MAISDKELESSIILGAKMIKSKFHLSMKSIFRLDSEQVRKLCWYRNQFRLSVSLPPLVCHSTVLIFRVSLLAKSCKSLPYAGDSNMIVHVMFLLY